MFRLAVTFGIYSYLIFAIGLFGWLTFPVISSITLFYFLGCVYLFRKTIFSQVPLKTNGFEKVILLFLILLGFINFIGALGPELSFDALWYHLTIPKEWIINQRIFYIPGNLLYYSVMPMFTHMLYIPGLLYGSEVIPKIIHFTFGALTAVAIYRFSRLYLNKFYSLLAALIFYSNLVIGWLSITAFTDLPRAFFEILALYLFALHTKTSKKKFLYQSGIVLGFAISSKVLSLPTIIFYFTALIVLSKNKSEGLRNAIQYSGISLLISLPWFIFAAINTGNPLFPIYSQYYSPSFSISLFNPVDAIKSFIEIFLFSPDPLSPIYLVILPLLIINFKSLYRKYRLLVLYMIITLGIWYITPQSGGGRFISAYLPAYSILTVLLIEKSGQIRKILIGVVLFIALISLAYRGFANAKFMPVLIGQTSREEFLMQNLNFSFGDFYDEKNEIRKIVGSEKVLLIGLHNIFYVNFPHDHISWSRQKEYKYILTQGQFLNKEMNEKYSSIYTNEKTRVTLYKLND